MSDVERNLFNQMITHHIKASTGTIPTAEREYHREMYKSTKHTMWDYQKEKRNNDKNS